jgi:Protein of unknown function (DUF3500)
MEPGQRGAAIVAEQAPYDIRSGTSPSSSLIEPLGVHSGQLGGQARELLDRLVHLYLDRLPRETAAREARRLGGGVHFAWEGPTVPGGRHYYRVQGDDLLIEYDNTTEDGNHAHTVLRRPRGDFGDDVLAAHKLQSH